MRHMALPLMIAGVTPQWKHYEFVGSCVQDFCPGRASLTWHLAYAAGTIEVAGVELTNLDTEAAAWQPRPTVSAPQGLIANGDFAAGLEGSWYSGGGERIEARIVETAADRGPTQPRPWSDTTGAPAPRSPRMRTWSSSSGGPGGRVARMATGSPTPVRSTVAIA